MGPDGKPIIQGNVSNCIVLRNLFTPALETEAGWDIDIRVCIGSLVHWFIGSLVTISLFPFSFNNKFPNHNMFNYYITLTHS